MSNEATVYIGDVLDVLAILPDESVQTCVRNIKPEGTAYNRPTRSHEYIFLFSKTRNYYYDADAVREKSTSPKQESHNQRYAKTYRAHTDRAEAGLGIQPGNVGDIGIHARPGKGGRNRRSVWSVSHIRVKGAHFATFPPALIEPCILAGAPIGGTVLDPFAGSGTTLGVAAKHGRRSIGIELNPEYAALVPERVAKLAPDASVVIDAMTQSHDEDAA